MFHDLSSSANLSQISLELFLEKTRRRRTLRAESEAIRTEILGHEKGVSRTFRCRGALLERSLTPTLPLIITLMHNAAPLLFTPGSREAHDLRSYCRNGRDLIQRLLLLLLQSTRLSLGLLFVAELNIRRTFFLVCALTNDFYASILWEKHVLKNYFATINCNNTEQLFLLFTICNCDSFCKLYHHVSWFYSRGTRYRESKNTC